MIIIFYIDDINYYYENTHTYIYIYIVLYRIHRVITILISLLLQYECIHGYIYCVGSWLIYREIQVMLYIMLYVHL